MVHRLKSALTTVELEARYTEEDPLVYHTTRERFESYEQDTDVILTSLDGDVFLGHVRDTFDYGLVIWIELD